MLPTTLALGMGFPLAVRLATGDGRTGTATHIGRLYAANTTGSVMGAFATALFLIPMLGLAGVAVKAGARSALATLWFIDDEATSRLVPEFYRQLRDNPTFSKAEALQRAQLKFLADDRFKHPSYWAPFLLINNWL